METSRFFEWFAFGVLACWAGLGLARALLLRARGIPVVVADWQRTPPQMLMDALSVACLLLWAYEILAGAWRFHPQMGPVVWHRVLVSSVPIRAVGAALMSAALLLYAVALRRLGNSWRLGIDRTKPGPLVTGGIYRWMRHPIYVAFDVSFVGTFLVLGRLVFLLLALVWVPLLHLIMLREERFLAELYDGAYRDYCRRVGRYLTWQSRGRDRDTG